MNGAHSKQQNVKKHVGSFMASNSVLPKQQQIY